jgi:predicted Rossmann fold flavoprotein
MRVGVIGAGPAGILAALSAAQHGAKVILFDSNSRAGKKLLLTGSGRCNLSNRNSVPQRYACDDMRFLELAWKEFDQESLVNFLDSLGISTYATEDGWYYPQSNSAGNVVEILNQLINAAEIKFQRATRIERITPEGYGFKLIGENQTKPIYVDSLVIASGGKAYPQTGSDGNLNGAIRGLGHAVLPIRPALAPMLLKAGVFDDLKGVRLDAACHLLFNRQVIGRSVGNIIFTEWGINGPGVMDLSYLVENANLAEFILEIDFLSENKEHAIALVEKAKTNGLPTRSAFLAILPEKIVNWGFARAGLDFDEPAKGMTKNQLHGLLEQFSATRAQVEGVKGYKYAQCSWGGVPAAEVDGSTMRSKKVAGLYFAGEVLNVVGPCGGYNLHWAFASGWIAGRGAAKRESQD